MVRRRAAFPPRKEPPPAPVRKLVSPDLVPCPVCGLGMAKGRGPNGLARHECRVKQPEAPPTIDSVMAFLLRRLQLDVESGRIGVQDAITALAALQKKQPAQRPAPAPKKDEAPKEPVLDPELAEFLQAISPS